MADTETACLFALFVHPAWEGRGIGRRLILCAETFLFAHHETIWLGTDATTGAANFYTRLGWTRRHQMPSGDTRFEKCRDLRPITSVTDQTKAG